jgi:hypothetical protein
VAVGGIAVGGGGTIVWVGGISVAGIGVLVGETGMFVVGIGAGVAAGAQPTSRLIRMIKITNILMFFMTFALF